MAQAAFEITLDALSGVPAPRWELTGRRASELARRLGSMPRAPAGEAPEPPGLGYRGFFLAASGWEAPARVYRGALRRGDEVRSDPERALERWLLETAGTEVSEGLRQAVLDDLTG